jgi:hypothetical protein
VRDYPVKRGMPVGRYQNEFVPLIVDIAHLPCLLLSQKIKIRFA